MMWRPNRTTVFKDGSNVSDICFQKQVFVSREKKHFNISLDLIIALRTASDISLLLNSFIIYIGLLCTWTLYFYYYCGNTIMSLTKHKPRSFAKWWHTVLFCQNCRILIQTNIKIFSPFLSHPLFPFPSPKCIWVHFSSKIFAFGLSRPPIFWC